MASQICICLFKKFQTTAEPYYLVTFQSGNGCKDEDDNFVRQNGCWDSVRRWAELCKEAGISVYSSAIILDL